MNALSHRPAAETVPIVVAAPPHTRTRQPGHEPIPDKEDRRRLAVRHQATGQALAHTPEGSSRPRPERAQHNRSPALDRPDLYDPQIYGREVPALSGQADDVS